MLLFWSAAALGQIARPTLEAHPDPLPAEEGCDRFEGQAAGNDPTVRVVLVLCEDAGSLTGKLQWSSLVSGWNVRRVKGHKDAASYALSDVGIESERPEPGWRFCPIDRYALTRDGDRLEGTYDSTDCNDHAAVTLTRMGTAPDPDAADPRVPELNDEPGSTGASGWACATAPVPGGVAWLAVLLARRRLR